jgi:2-oxo-4-hydroxy-4-carboxy-5-ureidoimidazoline decarboxylase
MAWPALDSCPEAVFTEAIAPLFEGAPRFLARLAAARPFGDAAALLAGARAIAHAMPEPEQLELIDAHPRLGAPPGSVSALSFREQGYDRAAADAAAETERARVAVELDTLNDAYESRFGFRYCVFVAGRPRAALLPGFRAALDAGRSDEIRRALDAVVDIAADRYTRLSSRPTASAVPERPAQDPGGSRP